MPRISPALSEIIKNSLFRAREHLECLDPMAADLHAELLSTITYEIARSLGIAAVYSNSASPVIEHLSDAIQNLTSIIDFDITGLEFEGDPEEVVRASRELMGAVHTIPLPAQPPAKTA
jgi:hypothetical protein